MMIGVETLGFLLLKSQARPEAGLVHLLFLRVAVRLRCEVGVALQGPVELRLDLLQLLLIDALLLLDESVMISQM